MKPCAHCSTPFTPQRMGQRVCSPRCAGRWVKAERKTEAAQIKAQRKAELLQIKKRKAALKTIPQLIKEAQHAFNAAIRERDKDKPCVSCGRPLCVGDGGSTGGDFDCGHFKSTGSASHLRFDERNAHGQCKHCNRYRAGNVVEYRIGLIQRIGLEAVEALENDNRVHKWQRDELIQIRAVYTAKLKALKETA